MSSSVNKSLKDQLYSNDDSSYFDDSTSFPMVVDWRIMPIRPDL